MVRPRVIAKEVSTNPTELASVVPGPLHYAFFCRIVVQKPNSTETSSVGLALLARPARIETVIAEQRKLAVAAVRVK